jgi:Tfp pilus assembly protein PilO
MRWIGLGQHGVRRLDLAGTGVCLVLSLVCYLTTVGPVVRQRSATAALRREMQAQQEKAVKLKTTMGTTKERLHAVQQDLAATAVQLDAAVHLNRRIAGLTRFLSACGLQIDDMQTGRVGSTSRYDLVPITIVGRGTYRQCVQLLHGLCATFPDMSVMRIELAGNPAQASEPDKFQIEMFWYAAPSRSTQNASPAPSSREGAASS